MARKKVSSPGGGLGFLVALFLIAVVIAAVLYPFYLVLAGLHHWIKARQITRELTGKIEDFWLSPAERDEFRESHLELKQQRAIVVAEEERANINEIGRNADGTISKRSNQGKEIRRNLDSAYQRILTLEERLEALECGPYHRWSDLNERVAVDLRHRYALATWFAVFVGVAIARFEAKPHLVWDCYQHFPQRIFNSDHQPEVWWACALLIIGSALAAILVYLISGAAFEKAGRAFSPEPDLVDLHNVDSPSGKSESPHTHLVRLLCLIAFGVGIGLWQQQPYVPPVEASASVTPALDQRKRSAPNSDKVSSLPQRIERATIVEESPPPVVSLAKVTIQSVPDGDTLALRRSPAADSAILNRLDNGDVVEILGPSFRNGETLWIAVRFRGIDGWVNKSFTKP